MKIIIGNALSATTTLKPYINDCVEDITKVSETVLNFINESKSDNNLKGKDFDRLRYHMQAYCDLFDEANKKISELPKTVSDVNKGMNDFADQNVWEDRPLDDYERLGYVEEQKKIWESEYRDREASKCNLSLNAGHMITVTDTSYDSKTGKYTSSTREEVCPRSIHKTPEVDEAYDKWQYYLAWYNHLSKLPGQDSYHYGIFETLVTNIVNSTNSKCEDIQVMTIADALQGLSNSSDVQQAFKDLITNGEYVDVPDWVNYSLDTETGAVSGWVQSLYEVSPTLGTIPYIIDSLINSSNQTGAVSGWVQSLYEVSPTLGTIPYILDSIF